MIIWHVVHVFPPEHAPAGVNAQESSEDFARMGHDVTVMTGWPNHPAGVLYDGWIVSVPGISRQREGYRLVRMWHPIHARKGMLTRMCYYFAFAVSSLCYGLFLGPVDMIICESTAIFGPIACWMLARIKRAQLVYKIHDVHPEAAYNAGLVGKGFVYNAMRGLDTFVCRRATKVLTLTEGMRKLVLARNLKEDHVVIGRHWVDGDKITPGDRDNPWRREHNIPLDKTVVLHAGTIGFVSGAEIVVKAAARLAHRKDLLFLFVGDGPLRQPCQDLARSLGVANIEFLPFQDASVLCQMQAAGDIGLVTLLERSGESSIPSKMHGYTAAGRPVIASVAADSPTAEIIDDGKFGVVVPPGKEDELARAIDQLSSDPERMRRMGHNARVSFMELFDRQIQVKKYDQLLSECVKGKKVHPLHTAGSGS